MTDMTNMFAGTNFNGDISKWDVARVTDMEGMFAHAERFDGDISKWDVSRVNRMSLMFIDGVFNRDISKWDVSRVKDMENMFSGNAAFNIDISRWDVSSVTDMSSAFFNAKKFNIDMSNWDVSRVKNMDNMFEGAASFTHKLCGTYFVNSRATKGDMFEGSAGSIAQTVCESTKFSPQSDTQLKSAIGNCLRLSPKGD